MGGRGKGEGGRGKGEGGKGNREEGPQTFSLFEPKGFPHSVARVWRSVDWHLLPGHTGAVPFCRRFVALIIAMWGGQELRYAQSGNNIRGKGREGKGMGGKGREGEGREG